MSVTAFEAAKLRVSDIDALERFYTTSLGLVVTARIEEGEGASHIREVFLAVGDAPAQFALIKFVNQPLPPPGEAIVTLAVNDLDAVIAAVVAHGGSDLTGPIEVPEHNVRLAFVADPEGHQIELLHRMV